MSPELLDPEAFGLKGAHATRKSDCYALGMVIYEILSGEAPFAPSKVPAPRILRGERPERPQGRKGVLFTDTIWGVLELCWKPQPSERLNAKAVLQGLYGRPYQLGSPSDMDGDVEADSDDHSDDTTSDIRMFSLPPPRLIVNNPRAITGPLSARGDTGLLVPSEIHPLRAKSPTRPVRRRDWLAGWRATSGPPG